jgi:cytochrome c553
MLARRSWRLVAVPNESRSTGKSVKCGKAMTRTLALIALVSSLTALGTYAGAKENWDKMCIKCHGADGKGSTPMGKKLNLKDLTDTKVQESFTDEKAYKSIKEGIKDGDKTRMKPAENLSDDDIKALVAHVRTLKK